MGDDGRAWPLNGIDTEGPAQMTLTPNRIQSRGFGKPPEPVRLRDKDRPPQKLARSVNFAGGTSGPAPKTEPKRNRALLDMANGEGCLLRVPGVCNRDPATTVACHSNWAEHGKSGARKADDCYSVWGCSACHAWLDQGSAHPQEKRRVFDAAFAFQRDIWLQIFSGLLDSTPKERAAVDWALKQIDGART